MGATPDNENLRTVYKELCTSYRSIDDFRTKLLGFLPLATGGIFFFVTASGKIGDIDEPILHSIGFFGIAIALGLFCFELYGIRKCTCLILVGTYLENELDGIKGQFAERPPGVLLGLINEPFAAGIIYPAVMAAWTYLALYSKTTECDKQMVALGVFVVGLILTLLFMNWLQTVEVPRLKNKLAIE